MDISRRMLIGAASAGAAVTLAGAKATAATATTSRKTPIFGPAPGIARLSSNENPYGPAPSAIRAMADAVSKGCYYGQAAEKRLIDMIAERNGVSPEQVVVGNGSTEVLSAAALYFMGKGTILTPELLWDTTIRYATAKGATVKRVALASDMNVDLAAMAAAVTPDVALVQLCNPNNPTGLVLDGNQLRTFVKAIDPKVTVLIDEAYNELADKPEYSSVVDLVKDHPNVIVARTFSKIYGMAGLRIGYAIASPETVKAINGYMMGMVGNTAGLAAAIASYNDTVFTSFSKQRIIEAREIMIESIKRAGLEALPSQTNFLFVKVPDADRFRDAMQAKGIMIRGAYGKWTQWSRVSTGKIEDVKRYAAAVPEALHA